MPKAKPKSKKSLSSIPLTRKTGEAVRGGKLSRDHLQAMKDTFKKC